jgi:TolB-like protein/DNA-binding winged helix-turn-helix (wHTH) protein
VHHLRNRSGHASLIRNLLICRDYLTPEHLGDWIAGVYASGSCWLSRKLMKYGMGDLVIDTGRQSVSRAGAPIPLPKLSYDLLLVLIRAAPNVVTGDQLMREVWPGLVVSPETVSKRVTLLRDSLGEDSHAPRYITTLRGRGYKIVAEVVLQVAPDVQAAPTPDVTGVPAVLNGRSVRKEAFLVVAAALLVIVMTVTWRYWVARPPLRVVETSPQPAPSRSIAVLPFLDMSEAKDEEYFADGMTEAIIDLLAKVPDLRVPARTSSFYFKSKAATVSEIGQQLNVAHVLEGSVRKSGTRLRITAQLIRADNGYHIWSETYDRNASDIFDVQDEIAAQVAQSMQLRLLDSPTPHLRTTSNADAYGLLLQGRFFGRRNNRQDRERSIDLYRRAIEIDPSYALAWAWLSTGYTVQALSRWSPPEPTFARAREAAARATELDPNLADGHGAIGQILEVHDWDFAGAKKEYERALALDSHNVRILNLNAHLAMDEGRLNDALHFYREATISDPLSPAAQDGVAYSLWATGKSTDAESVYAREGSLSQSDSPAWLGLLMIELGDKGGLEVINKDHDEVAKLVALSMANYRLARRNESDAELAELIKSHPDSATRIAQILAYRGEFDEAFKWTDKAYAAHEKDLLWVKVHVGLRNLPHDARWVGLLQKMNLPE